MCECNSPPCVVCVHAVPPFPSVLFVTMILIPQIEVPAGRCVTSPAIDAPEQLYYIYHSPTYLTNLQLE